VNEVNIHEMRKDSCNRCVNRTAVGFKNTEVRYCVVTEHLVNLATEGYQTMREVIRTVCKQNIAGVWKDKVFGENEECNQDDVTSFVSKDDCGSRTGDFDRNISVNGKYNAGGEHRFIKVIDCKVEFEINEIHLECVNIGGS